MCVIIIAEEARPDERMLNAAWDTNDDGAGIAWREPAKDGKGIEVVWKKGLSLDQAKQLASEVPLPYVIHFRSASQGGVWRNLTHPFEVSEKSSDATEGRTKNPVLFHNGTWGVWADKALDAAIRSGVDVPFGMWNDSRAIAWMSTPGICGWGFMNLLHEQRGVIFGPTWSNVFKGPGWAEVKDSHDHKFWCSNDRPWKNQVTQGYGGGQVTDRRPHVMGPHMALPPARDEATVKHCAFGQCKNKNIDSHNYCPDHTGGKEKMATTSVLSRGAANKDPFHLPPNVRTLTREEAQGLLKAGKISKNLMKALNNLFERATNGQLTPKQRQKAQAGLDLASRCLIGSGRLPLTLAQSGPQGGAVV